MAAVLQVHADVLPLAAEEVGPELSQGQAVQIFAPERTTPESEVSSRNIYVKVGEVDTKITGLATTPGKLERLTVRGTLRVIHHPAATIDGVAFEPFTEVRLEE